MFTGIVEYVEEMFIKGRNVYIKNPYSDIVLGESIALNGVCLTVEKIENNYLIFGIGEETLNRTNLKVSKKVNIERALKVGSRLGGHFVLGHVDGTVKFIDKQLQRGSYLFQFSNVKENWAIVEKGSITLNGISLTVAKKSLDTFFVQIIPHTIENTNLKYLLKNEKVNYEIDVFARYIKGGKNEYGY
ncbi:riboflavin synthase subunit alpha [Tepiditoga spiralis]|uniref:Riboflavin synthase n=1 Tax=Tepiditoga spiralis TaxID=2108365 RepID=A0A7G1G9A3_9BACT|nr:riboflavin synthase [Tepiditoga spiralis]BBE31517.1 riboflavin synthase subunit alpha [Tepiditoga spiralis]